MIKCGVKLKVGCKAAYRAQQLWAVQIRLSSRYRKRTNEICCRVSPDVGRKCDWAICWDMTWWLPGKRLNICFFKWTTEDANIITLHGGNWYFAFFVAWSVELRTGAKRRGAFMAAWIKKTDNNKNKKVIQKTQNSTRSKENRWLPGAAKAACKET